MVGAALSTAPMKATGMPSIFLITYGGRVGRPVRASTTLADTTGIGRG